MNVAVIGGGRMGLPLSCLMADRGASVVVCDINEALIEMINKGETPYEEPELSGYMARVHATGRLTATTRTTEAVRSSQVVVTIVPAFLTGEREIDMSILKAVSHDIAKGLQPGALVCYETTVSVGGTRKALVPILEKESGLKAGHDFFVAFSPERVKANLVFSRLRETPKIVGGYDDASNERAIAFYTKYLGAPVVDVKRMESAEMAKLADMLYRDVNIALANELASFAEVCGVDFELVRQAANTSGESALLIPGIGVGGHCTPVYPYFITKEAARHGVPQQIAESARRINDAQPERHIARLEREWGSLAGKNVHILGLAFRPEVKVSTYSPAVAIRDAIEHRGGVATLEDPMYSDQEVRERGYVPAHVGVDPVDAVVLNTGHMAFRDVDFAAWRRAGVRAVVDGRNFWPSERVSAAGLLYLTTGKPVIQGAGEKV